MRSGFVVPWADAQEVGELARVAGNADERHLRRCIPCHLRIAVSGTATRQWLRTEMAGAGTATLGAGGSFDL